MSMDTFLRQNAGMDDLTPLLSFVEAFCDGAAIPPSVRHDATLATEEVFVAPYNDLAAVQEILKSSGDEIAAVIVEPIAGNMGLVEPEPGFLEGLRAATSECGTLLIFDEVINGFRLGPTTYGHMAGVAADITTLGKIIGGGMPIGAIGGS